MKTIYILTQHEYGFDMGSPAKISITGFTTDIKVAEAFKAETNGYFGHKFEIVHEFIKQREKPAKPPTSAMKHAIDAARRLD